MPRPTRITLTAEQKMRIVTELACMSSVSEVRDTIKKEFALELNLTTILYYDPTVTDSKLAKKWATIFTKTREQFLKDCSRVPIAHEAYRLARLQKLLEKELERDNTVGARETLEQAAKEKGGAFTNRRELTGAGGKDLPIAQLTVQFIQPEKANGDG